MRVGLSRDHGGSWALLEGAVLNTGATSGRLSWVVAGDATTAARVRVTWVNGSATDISDVAFVIATPMITMTAPNVGAPWRVLGTHRVLWSHNLGTTETVRVEMSFDNGATWT